MLGIKGLYKKTIYLNHGVPQKHQFEGFNDCIDKLESLPIDETSCWIVWRLIGRNWLKFGIILIIQLIH